MAQSSAWNLFHTYVIFLREAAVKLRHTPYSILDDETFVVMEEDQDGGK